MKWTDQKLIYNLLSSNGGGLTASEIESQLRRAGLHRRLSEMEKLGLAKKVGKRKCTVTGRISSQWFADDSPPKAQLKKSPTHELRKLRARVEFLEKENEMLKTGLQKAIMSHNHYETN